MDLRKEIKAGQEQLKSCTAESGRNHLCVEHSDIFWPDGTVLCLQHSALFSWHPHLTRSQGQLFLDVVNFAVRWAGLNQGFGPVSRTFSWGTDLQGSQVQGNESRDAVLSLSGFSCEPPQEQTMSCSTGSHDIAWLHTASKLYYQETTLPQASPEPTSTLFSDSAHPSMWLAQMVPSVYICNQQRCWLSGLFCFNILGPEKYQGVLWGTLQQPSWSISRGNACQIPALYHLTLQRWNMLQYFGITAFTATPQWTQAIAKRWRERQKLCIKGTKWKEITEVASLANHRLPGKYPTWKRPAPRLHSMQAGKSN